MKLKIRKTGDEASIMLPQEMAHLFSDGSEIELFHLRDGIYLIAASGEIEKGIRLEPVKAQLPKAMEKAGIAQGGWKAPSLSLTPDEAQVASKLTSIKFENRQVPQVEKGLNAAEKKAVSSLLAKKLVSVMKSAKYPKGVFSISDALYASTRTGQPGGMPLRSPPINTVDHLRRLGYMILDNENEAKGVMPVLQAEITTDEVKGVRGFDKKYYVLLRSFYLQNEGRLLALLDKSPATADAMAPEMHLTPEAVRTLLIVLSDGGEVIEKQKGVWERA